MDEHSRSQCADDQLDRSCTCRPDVWFQFLAGADNITVLQVHQNASRIVLVCACLSLVSCLTLIRLYKHYTELQTFINKIILMHTISCLGVSFVLIVFTALGIHGYLADYGPCITQGVLMQFCVSAAVLWLLVLGVHSLVHVNRIDGKLENSCTAALWNKPIFHEDNKAKLFRVYQWLVWSVAFLYAILILFYNAFAGPVYGCSNGVWCWIRFRSIYLWAVGTIAPIVLSLVVLLFSFFKANTPSRLQTVEECHRPADSFARSTLSAIMSILYGIKTRTNRSMIYILLCLTMLGPSFLIQVINAYKLHSRSQSIVSGMPFNRALLYSECACIPLAFGLLNLIIFSTQPTLSALTVKEYLKLPNAIQKFRNFLKSEFNDENIDFIEACNRIISALSQGQSLTALDDLLDSLVTKFVLEGAEREVNISYGIRMSLNSLDSSKRGRMLRVLRQARDEVCLMLDLDAFRRYKDTEEYRRHVDEMKRSQFVPGGDPLWLLPVKLIFRSKLTSVRSAQEMRSLRHSTDV